MKPEYAAWIADFAERALREVQILGGEHMSREELIRYAVGGRCWEAVRAMATAFPELRRVRGHYDHAEHWWCETREGEIIDPTAAQFQPGGTYNEYRGPDPFGKCMNCADYVWTKAFSGALLAGMPR